MLAGKYLDLLTPKLETKQKIHDIKVEVSQITMQSKVVVLLIKKARITTKKIGQDTILGVDQELANQLHHQVERELLVEVRVYLEVVILNLVRLHQAQVVVQVGHLLQKVNGYGIRQQMGV